MSSGGGGSSAPTNQTITQSTIPDWAKPYALKLLGTAENLTYNQPYQSYEGQRIAGFNPLQEQALSQIQQQQVAPQIGQATGFAGLAGLQAQKLGQYTPYAGGQDFYTSPEFQQMQTSFERASAAPTTSFQMQGPADVSAERIQAAQMGPVRDVGAMQFDTPQMAGFERVAASSPYDIERASGYQYGQLAMTPAERVRAAALQQYQMGPAERVEAEKFGLGAMTEYMSPYMQDVVEKQKQAATRDFARQLPGM
jgi:hypothetical protein